MGGPGADSLAGGTGSDPLVGGGADTLTGGPGTDTVLLRFLPQPRRRRDLGDPRRPAQRRQRRPERPGRRRRRERGRRRHVTAERLPPGRERGPQRPRRARHGPRPRRQQPSSATTSKVPARRSTAATARPDRGSRVGHRQRQLRHNARERRLRARLRHRLHERRGARRLRARERRDARPRREIIGRNGVVRARIDCTDPRGCVMRGLALTRRGHEASIGGPIRVIKIPFGESRMASAQILPEIWKRRRHGRSLRVKLDPSRRRREASQPRGPSAPPARTDPSHQALNSLSPR